MAERLRGRSIESILARMPPPDVEPRMRDLVKRPTPLGYRRVASESPEERLRHGFVLQAFAERFGERVRASRA